MAEISSVIEASTMKGGVLSVSNLIACSVMYP